MGRALVQLLPMEMAILGLFEFGLSFALILAMLTSGDPAVLLGSTDLTRDCVIFAAMLAVTIAGTAATIGLYRPEVCIDRRRFLVSGTIAALLAFPAILLVSGAYRMSLSVDHILWLARLLAVWLPFVLLFRLGLSVLAAHVPMTRRVLIVGPVSRARALQRRLAAGRNWLFEPIVLDWPLTKQPNDRISFGAEGLLLDSAGPGLGGAPSPRIPRDRRVWGIVIAGNEPAPEIHGAILEHKLRGVPVYCEAAFQEHHLGRIELDAIQPTSPMFSDGFRDGYLSRAVKRVVDIGVSLALTIVTLPLMLLTALMIKLDSPGPVFYRQVRTGLHGKPFTLFKFRSMTMNAEAAGKPRWAEKRDPRITRVGTFIRAGRIDELPQLFNVLRGEMSMIGPRPERPMFVEELARAIPFYNQRGYVKPGLTGWAQVNYPYGASVEDAREKLAYDLYYVKNRSLLLDLLILISTVRVILFREGAR
jgi:exopolysaccharide biosynthesis polyprenyl glycosylphosphotransferase